METQIVNSDLIRGHIDLMVLRVIWDGDSYGYEISKSITALSQGYIIKETTLYSAFARLVKLGYLSSYPGEYSGGRGRTYYSLTEHGREIYRQKCREWANTRQLVEKFILSEE